VLIVKLRVAISAAAELSTGGRTMLEGQSDAEKIA